jgi:hypothetical protein
MKSIMFFVNITAIVVALVFSIEFYLQINIFFAVFCITLEATKPIFARRILDKEIGLIIKGLIIIIIVLSTFLSLLGTISNSTNLLQEDLKKQYKQIVNEKWQENNKNIAAAEGNLNYSKQELEKYPNLETYLANLKAWENKSNKITDWENNKKLLQDRIVEKENILTSLRNKTINKYQKIKTKSNGYSEMLTLLSKFTDINKSNIILILTIFMSLGLEIIIFTSSLICKKDTIVDVKKISENGINEIGNCTPEKKICSYKAPINDTYEKSDHLIINHKNQGLAVEKLKNEIQEMSKNSRDDQKRSYPLVLLRDDQSDHMIKLEDDQSDHISNIDHNIKKIAELLEKEFGEELPNREEIRQKLGCSDRKFRKIMKDLTDNNLIKRSKNGLTLVK